MSPDCLVCWHCGEYFFRSKAGCFQLLKYRGKPNGQLNDFFFFFFFTKMYASVILCVMFVLAVVLFVFLTLKQRILVCLSQGRSIDLLMRRSGSQSLWNPEEILWLAARIATDLTLHAVPSPEICFDATLFPANTETKVAAFPITTSAAVNTVPWEGARLELICVFDGTFCSPC